MGGIASERVQIERILPGSVIVVFAILPSANGAPISPSTIAVLASDEELVLGGAPASSLLIVTEAPLSPPQPEPEDPSLFDRLQKGHYFGTGLLLVIVPCVASHAW